MSKHITGKGQSFHRDLLLLVASSFSGVPGFSAPAHPSTSTNTAAHPSGSSIPFECASAFSFPLPFLNPVRASSPLNLQQSQRIEGIVGNVRKVVGEIRNV